VLERTFEVRGVVEGFYGPPWSHDARLELLEFIGAHDMNAYAYAPKDDEKHRAQWREPYDASELTKFAELVDCARGAGVRFGFAMSPGLDVSYESPDDRALLLEKLVRLGAAGVSWFLLLLDDIPMQPGLGPRQGELSAALLDALQAELDDATLTVCPTEYVGTRSSSYLTELARSLPPSVDVMWTGPTVCSPVITADQARARAEALAGRPPILWDNYPVNDATMTESLHLGPYAGRDAELVGAVRGVLCNPMVQPRASKVPLATAAAFFARPDTYAADSAWADALQSAGGADAEPLAVLAHACVVSPLHRPEELELARLVAALAEAIDGAEWPALVTPIATRLRAARALGEAFRDVRLAAELAPWIAAARVEAEAGLAALRLVQQVRPVASLEAGGARESDAVISVGRAAPPVADRAMEHAFVMLFAWKAARRNEHVCFGPRFALYTPVVQLADGSAGLDASLAVREDGNAIDTLCRLALAAYDDWTSDAGATVRVFVDGEERACAAGDGRFDAHGTEVVVRSGRHATRVDEALPFRDRRLA
jgi:hyaluronoglucosaminidase